MQHELVGRTWPRRLRSFSADVPTFVFAKEAFVCDKSSLPSSVKASIELNISFFRSHLFLSDPKFRSAFSASFSDDCSGSMAAVICDHVEILMFTEMVTTIL